MVDKECNLRAGVYKVQTFGTTHGSANSAVNNRITRRKTPMCKKRTETLFQTSRQSPDWRSLRSYLKPRPAACRPIQPLSVSAARGPGRPGLLRYRQSGQ